MSYTEIVKFTKTGRAESLADIGNAWRGAMAIWRTLEKRYLPPYVPSWGTPKEEYSRFATIDEEPRKEVWGLWEDPKLSPTDKIVLGSTFDNVIVLKKDIPELLKAFREFECDGNCSLSDQANAIENEFASNKDTLAIAWNQTSVCENKWLYWEENGRKRYNILKDDEHWDLFESIKEVTHE